MIFVDTSFWIGISAEVDARHRVAVDLLRAHGDQRLVTTNHVRGETWTFMRRRYGHRDASGVLNRLERLPRLTIEFVSEELEDQALRWLSRHHEREYSFVDATSFALMSSLRIKEALAFDGDFAAAGFVELRP